MKLLILSGPNLNLLGTREPEIYGSETLEGVERFLREAASSQGIELDFFQSNSEGALIDALHAARKDCAGVVFNPGAYTHTSIALRDAISAIQIPVVEVHLSNVHAREEFRKRSYLAPVCIGTISGFGTTSYRLGVDALLDYLKRRH